jgi:hypothetical protein
VQALQRVQDQVDRNTALARANAGCGRVKIAAMGIDVEWLVVTDRISPAAEEPRKQKGRRLEKWIPIDY